MKRVLSLVATTGVLFGLTACAGGPQASCDKYLEVVGNHLAATIQGESDFGKFLRELNVVRDGSPEEMKAVLNTDLKNMADSPTTDAMPTETAKFCQEYIQD